MRIKFIVFGSNASNGDLTTELRQDGSLEGVNDYFLTPIYYFLKSFYKKIGKYYNKYIWLPTEYGEFKNTSVKNIISIIEKEKPDIICFSMFLWNFDVQIKIANIIKQKHPNIKLIAGGPSIDHKNPNTANNYPFIDYFVYGDGEKAFTMLLDSFYEPIDEKTIPNLITKEFKTNHEILRFKDYPAFSPYCDLKEDFINEHNQITDYLNKNTTNNYVLTYSFERIRGCPYACTFCDWSGGLHHKLNKRLGDWKEEIKFLSKFNNISMHWIDANIGMMKEDIEIFKFGLSYTTNSFSFSGGNMAKLHKSNVFDIWRAIYEHGRDNVFKVSLQHQDEQILKNINRPELPWNEHKKLLINFRQKYNKAEYKVELIHGLPGATIEAHKKQLIEFSEIPISIASLYAWELLHSSPAYDKSYQEKHNLKIITAGVVNTNVINSTIDDLYHNVLSDNYNPIEIYQSERICDSNLGFKEYLIITYMTILYNMLFETTLTTSEYNKIRFINFLDYAMPIIEKLAGEQTKDWDEKLEKYGFIIFGLPFGSNKTQTVQLGLGLTMICNKLFSGLLSGNIQTPWWDAYGHIEDKTKQRGSLSEV